jgi:PEP-CTERM motif
MRTAFAMGAVALLGAFTSAPAQAQFFENSTGLASPAETVDFNIFGLSDNEEVTNQSQTYGVTFSPFVYYNPQGGFFPNGRVGNFTFPTEPAFVDPVTFNFTKDLTAAAFQMAADGTPYTFTALLNGTAVASGTETIGDSPAPFIGFTGVTFNAIEIANAGTGGGPYWLIGNLQFGSSLVAPEPSTWAMLLLGFAGLGFLGYRAKRKAVVAAS